MYLRTILELEEENIVPLRARISERLGHSGPTVSQTVGRMERDGLVVVSGDRHLELTDEGRSKAVARHAQAPAGRAPARRRHRARLGVRARRGLPLGARDERAGRAPLLELLGHPTESPYGNPIPGLDELGAPATARFTEGVVNLVDARPRRDGPIAGVIRRLGEPAQVDPELLQQLKQAGVLPGATGDFLCRGFVRRSCRSTASTTGSNCPTRSPRTSSSTPESRYRFVKKSAKDVTNGIPSRSL